MLGRAADALRLGRAVDLERQLDVPLDGPPVEQDRSLEDHPVVAVEAGLRRRLAVDRHRARRSARSGRRRSAAAWTCRSPDGPISETNSPAPTVRSMPTSASTAGRPARAAAKTLETPEISTTGAGAPAGRRAAVHRHAPIGSTRRSWRSIHDSTTDHQQVDPDPQHRRDDDRRPQERRVQRVVLHPGDDLAGEAVLDQRRQLADDRADDRRRCGDPERREQVRARGRQAELAQDRAARRPRTSASARAPAGRRRAGRGARRS